MAISFQIAEKILEAPEPAAAEAVPASAVEGLYIWLHTLIAGELDVDRCDYVLRDTRHYGFEFASYDLRRVVDNLIVVSPGGDHRLALAVLPQGQSAAESFLLARYRMYQWGIRHHKVVQIAAALRKVMRDLLRPAISGGQPKELHQFLLDLREIIESADKPDFVETHREGLDRFVGYDDIWWMTKMREAAIEDPGDSWLELATYRRPGPISLWKRVFEFPADLANWNRALPERDDPDASAAWEKAHSELEEKDVLVVRHSFKPWERLDKTDPDSGSVLGVWEGNDRKLVPLTEVSPLIKELRNAWLADIQVHGFAAEEGLIDAADLLGSLPVDAKEEDNG